MIFLLKKGLESEKVRWGHKERELFDRGRVAGWDVCGRHSQTSGASATPAGIQESISARQDHQTLIEPEEKDPTYTLGSGLRPGLNNRRNRTPQFHLWGH